jgi:alpha-tubulin suppressor-like RCC1 family protein
VGCNKFGTIGDGTNNDCSTIKKIKIFSNIFVVDIVCGLRHCLSISKKGEIYSWGYYLYGQIGIGKSGENENENKQTPIKIFEI